MLKMLDRLSYYEETKEVESKHYFNFAQADHPRDGYGEAKWERLYKIVRGR